MRAKLLPATLASLAGLFAVPAGAGPVYVRLDFSGTASVTAAMQANILACIQAKYNTINNLQIGTGPGPADAAQVITANFTDENQPRLRGITDKGKYTCKSFVSTYVNSPSGLFDTTTPAGITALTNALCETGAHEIGHTLCAVHSQNAPRGRTIKQSNGAQIDSNGLALDTMTQGGFVTNAEKAQDNTRHTLTNLGTIQSAVNILKDGRPKWDLVAAFEGEERVQMIRGIYRDSVFIDGEAVDPVREDQVIATSITLSGNPLFGFGWIDAASQFFHAIPAGTSTETLEFEGGDLIDFAVGGAPGGPYDGQVFPLHAYGHVTQQSGILSPGDAELPAVTTPYYQMLEIHFDLGSIGQPPVVARLSTVYSTGTDGMRVLTVPVPVAIEEFEAGATPDGVLLRWHLSRDALRDLAAVSVERADAEAGPYTALTPSMLVPAGSMSFRDGDVRPRSSYWYRLVLVGTDGSRSVSRAVGAVVGKSDGWRTRLDVLAGAHAGDPVEIRYRIAQPDVAVRVAIYGVQGRRVRTLDAGRRGPGEYLRVWDRRDTSGVRLARGVCVVRLTAGRETLARKFVLAH